MSDTSGSWKGRLKWASTFGGIGGTIGGAVGLLADIGSAGLSGGTGTLIGSFIGASIGAALSRRLENSSVLIEKGEAFEYLYSFRSKIPEVANPRLVESVLKQIPSFDKNDDNRRWYAKTDLDDFLDRARATPRRPPVSPRRTP